MKLAGVLLILLFAATARAQGIVTVFREGHTTPAPFNAGYDKWPTHLHLKMLMDGTPMAVQNAGHFVSFTLAAGRHTISSNGALRGSLTFDIIDGEHMYIRPVVSLGVGFLKANYSTEYVITACPQAQALGKDTEPMKPKDVEGAGAIAETRFPDTCPAPAK